MAQGQLKQKATNIKKPAEKSLTAKKGNPVKKSKIGGVFAKNKNLQKKLWATATNNTEMMLASKAKACGKLTILKSLALEKKAKEEKKKKLRK
ncbi:hypothetical protein HK099_007645 [Clydaea vesicula]|uniref:Uncharacterized protein n=1 Tax=Clydaea vesicula TaxID=447962 RepID=A0AAD5Y0I8_9FUNG|nr:hypothetical protein HK099_007645 [Clydaea vesicula]KAJ3394787.1 hypothetical protein HDU92_006576 [Lobulomyces angularis]